MERTCQKRLRTHDNEQKLYILKLHATSFEVHVEQEYVENQMIFAGVVSGSTKCMYMWKHGAGSQIQIQKGVEEATGAVDLAFCERGFGDG